MNKLLLALTGIALASACSAELTNWKGTPFNEINEILQKNDVLAVYFLPHLWEAEDSGKKEIQTPSFALLESAEDIKHFCRYFANNCKDSDHPQLLSNRYKLVIVANKIDPMLSLRAYKFKDEWYFWYDFRPEDKDKHITFTKVCDKEFSDFLTSKLVKMQPADERTKQISK